MQARFTRHRKVCEEEERQRTAAYLVLESIFQTLSTSRTLSIQYSVLAFSIDVSYTRRDAPRDRVCFRRDLELGLG